MVELVTTENRDAHEQLLHSMFEDRKAVFVDLLKWDVPHDGRCERDQFDDAYAEYLIVTDTETSVHLASLRMLRTDRPHILGSIFPNLCDASVPAAPDIREVSRICLSPRHRDPERCLYRDLLASAMTEYALLTGIRAYTAVSEMGRLSRVLSAGWRCEPLGMPRKIGPTMVGALMIHIDTDTIRRLQAFGRYHSGALRVEERSNLAA
ncbi:MAG TPA: acyl-homoserine-lactone synthase [Allosphingosinicella sp.]